MNPAQFLQVFRNPQGFLQNVMQNNQVMQNPMARNALEMMQKGDNKGLEQLARNLCKQNNINVDDALSDLKKRFGMQ